MGRIFNNNLFLQENGGGGGAGGTTNYDDLTNKPKVNGIVLSGNKTSADLGITTLTPFPSTWPTTGRFEDLLAAIRVDTIAVKGASFLGEVTFDDLPANLGNAEIKIEILEGTTSATKVIHSVITSGNRQPYRWEYTSWNSGNSNSGWISFQLPLTAGTGISIENNVISTTVGNVYTQSNLLAGNGVEIVDEPVEGGIDEHTLACWHFDDSTNYITGSGEVRESTIARGNASIDSSFHMFGTGSVKSDGEGAKIRTIQLSLAQSFTYDFWLLKRGPSNYSEGIGFYNDYARNIFSYLVYHDTPDTAAFYVEGKDTVNVDISEINSDSWYHVALVYDASSDKGIGKLFINGILKATIIDITKSTNTFPYTLISPGIGCYMDELRISDIARPLNPDGTFPVPTKAYSLAVSTGNKVINNTGVTSINTKKGNVILTANDINVTYTHEGAETTTSIKEFADTIDHAIENINSLMPVNAYTAENLIAGKNITIEEVPPEGGIDSHTLACWHFDGKLTDEVKNEELDSSLSDTGYKKFGSGACSGYVITSNNVNLTSNNSFTVDFWYRHGDTGAGSQFSFGLNGINRNNTESNRLHIVYEESKGGLYLKGGAWSNTSMPVYSFIPVSDTFYHFALVYDNATREINLFLNGISIFNQSLSTGTKVFEFFGIDNSWRAGCDLDELRISDIARPLTPDGKFPVPTKPYSVAVPTGKVAINNAITKTSQLTNDSGFITDVPVATTTVAGKMKADGTTITVTEDGTISAVTPSIDLPSDVYTQSNLLAGNGVEIVNEPVEGGIDEHTLACWHFDEDLEPIKFDSQLTSNVRGTIEQDYYKFGNGSCSGPNIRIMNSGLNTSDFTVDYFFMPKDYIGGENTYIGDVRIYINGLGIIVYFNNNKIYEFSIKQYGIWTHFAIRRKDLIYTIYVNGQSVFQSTDALTTMPTKVFEAATGGSIYFYIDELRISDIARPLTPDGKFPVPTQPYSLAVPTGNKVINNTITKTSQLTNDSGFLTSVNSKTGNVVLTGADIQTTYTYNSKETTTTINAFADAVFHNIDNVTALIPTKAVTSDNVTKIVKLTQAEYDQLETKDDSTFYAIVG